MFAFNLGDGIGKFIPNKFFVSNSYLVHGISFYFLIPFVYFLLMMLFPFNETYSSPYLRLAIILISGLTNGYNTNNIMNLAASRFRKPMDKGKIGYFCIFFLLLAIAISGFVNTTYLTG